MAAIFNGLLPLRRKENAVQGRALNTRWGDAAISAPIHGGWSSNASTNTQMQSSPEIDRDLPPTPPQNHNDQDGVFIVQNMGSQDESEDETAGADRDNFTITIPLPWKKKRAPTHARNSSLNGTLNPRFTATRRTDPMLAPLSTSEAAAIALPESRISSPVGRNTATSPVLSFRTRLASPNLGDILSPVAEGFAKEGPSSRPNPAPSSLQYIQTVPLDRPPTAGSAISNKSRDSLIHHNAEGIGAGTMSSQSTISEPVLELSRPPSRGLGATAHMRASSRGPRANSRGPRAGSVEPSARRAPSVEPVFSRAGLKAVESAVPDVLEDPARQSAPSMEPSRRRAPSIEPSAKRAPSVEPAVRRAPSAGPSHSRRALSREPRGRRRGISAEPTPKIRFRSEAPRPTYRPNSFSSNDGSLEAESDNDGSSESEQHEHTKRFNSRRPYRRRSIASPFASPTTASFSIVKPAEPSPRPALNTDLDSITSRAGLVHPMSPPIAPGTAPRHRSQSRTRGLWGDMYDDFRLLGRDVHIVKASTNHVTHPAAAVAPSPIITQAQPSVLSSNSILQHAPPSGLSSNPAILPTSNATTTSNCNESERIGYTSESSLSSLPPVAHHLHNHQHIHIHNQNINQVLERRAEMDGAKAMLAALAHERRDQLRHEEQEREREKAMRKIERERERVLASNTFSDCESVASGHMSGSEKMRRGYDSDATSASVGITRGSSAGTSKTMVPNAEEIWG